MAERKLTERQKAFCRLCAEGVKPIAAAKEVGYRNAYRSAGDMLRNERIREEIARLQRTGEQQAVQKVEEDTPAEKAEI